MDKRGVAVEEGILSVGRVILIAAIALVVVLSINNVYSSKQDIRPTETVVIGKVVMNCISPGGILDSSKELSECFRLDETEYSIYMLINSLNSNYSLNKSFGSLPVKTNCELYKKGIKFKKYPSCIDQRYYVLVDHDGKLEKSSMDLFIGIGKTRENL